MKMTEDQWYGSDEHFKTEMNYSDYLKKLKKKKKKKAKSKKHLPFGIKIKFPKLRL